MLNSPPWRSSTLKQAFVCPSCLLRRNSRNSSVNARSRNARNGEIIDFRHQLSTQASSRASHRSLAPTSNVARSTAEPDKSPEEIRKEFRNSLYDAAAAVMARLSGVAATMPADESIMVLAQYWERIQKRKWLKAHREGFRQRKQGMGLHRWRPDVRKPWQPERPTKASSDNASTTRLPESDSIRHYMSSGGRKRPFASRLVRGIRQQEQDSNKIEDEIEHLIDSLRQDRRISSLSERKPAEVVSQDLSIEPSEPIFLEKRIALFKKTGSEEDPRLPQGLSPEKSGFMKAEKAETVEENLHALKESIAARPVAINTEEPIARPSKTSTKKSSGVKEAKNSGELVIDKIDASALSPQPINREQPPVPRLSYGLDRVLFNPGVYNLQDHRTQVYNFDPYLQTLMPVEEFDFNALKAYVTSSKDRVLTDLARGLGKKYIGSTSSMTGILSHFHYLLSNWREINVSSLSKGFSDPLRSFTQLSRTPNAAFLQWNDGVYAIDGDKEFASETILSSLGKSMEKLLTLEMDDFERYRKSNPGSISKEEKETPESYQYSTMGDFLMRSQLDAKDSRLPGNGIFDLKTRAVVSVRMDAENYEEMRGYQIKDRFGEWESYEREYFDMIRSVFLKYSLQVRMGRMDGIFVAFHNTERIFGFQYIPLAEMDMALHGQTDLALGDQEFKVSLDLFNKVLNKATERYPGQSIRLYFEARDLKETCMWIFAEPVSDKEIKILQSRNDSKIEAFRRETLGLDGSSEQEGKPIQWEDLDADIQQTMDSDDARTPETLAATHTNADEEDVRGAESPDSGEARQQHASEFGAVVPLIEEESNLETYSEKLGSSKTPVSGETQQKRFSEFDAVVPTIEGEAVLETGPEKPGPPEKLDLSEIHQQHNSEFGAVVPPTEEEAVLGAFLENSKSPNKTSLDFDKYFSSNVDSAFPKDPSTSEGDEAVDSIQEASLEKAANSSSYEAHQVETIGRVTTDDAHNSTEFRKVVYLCSAYRHLGLEFMAGFKKRWRELRKMKPDLAYKGWQKLNIPRAVAKIAQRNLGPAETLSELEHLYRTATLSFWLNEKSISEFQHLQSVLIRAGRPSSGHWFTATGYISIRDCDLDSQGQELPSEEAELVPPAPETQTELDSETKSKRKRKSKSITPPPTTPSPADLAEDLPQPKEANDDPSSSSAAQRPLLALRLSVVSKLDGKVVDRPDNIAYSALPRTKSASDTVAAPPRTNKKWTVEYTLSEMEPETAVKRYAQCKERRRSRLDEADRRRDKAASYYLERLRRLSKEGRKYLAEMEMREKARGGKVVYGREN